MIEYYKSKSYLLVENKNGDQWQVHDEAGQELVLNEGKIKIISVYKNFKIDIIDGNKVVTDSAGTGINPAGLLPKNWSSSYERITDSRYIYI